MHRDCPPFSYLYEDSLGLTFSHLFFSHSILSMDGDRGKEISRHLGSHNISEGREEGNQFPNLAARSEMKMGRKKSREPLIL